LPDGSLCSKEIMKFIFGLEILILSACGSTQSGIQEDQAGPYPEKYKTLAVQKYGKEATYLLNESKAFALCINAGKFSTKHPQHSVDFFVYDISGSKIIHEASLVDGSVEWINDHQVLVRRIQGTVKYDENSQSNADYIYDVTLRKILDANQAHQEGVKKE